MQVRRIRLDVVVLQRVDARRDVIVTNIVRLRVTEVTVRRIRQVHDRLIVAIDQTLDIRRECLVDMAVRRHLILRVDGERCLLQIYTPRRFCYQLIVLIQKVLQLRRDVFIDSIITNIIRIPFFIGMQQRIRCTCKG